MYAQCPECRTIFRFAAAELAAANASVRCGHCNAVFDALRTVAEHLPPEPIDSLPAHPVAAAPPQLGMPVYRPQGRQTSLFFDPDERPRAAERPGKPAFARVRRPQRRHRTWPWVLACLLLAIALAVQAAWVERARWLESDTWRPRADAVCAKLAALGCQLPPRRDLSRLALSSRDIRPHPSVAGALIISATVRNDAPFAQAFPVVEIVLSDLDERRVAMRRFQPAEYLTDPQLLAAGLAAGASAALVFEVVDPGRDAVAFEFRFD